MNRIITPKTAYNNKRKATEIRSQLVPNFLPDTDAARYKLDETKNNSRKPTKPILFDCWVKVSAITYTFN